MIQFNTTTFDAESTDIATRVNLSTTIDGVVTVRLGDEDNGFVAGDFIEFLNDGPATIVFEGKGFTNLITMDLETGPTATLEPKQRAVAYYVGPDDYQWDIETSHGVNQSTAYMFQVGVPAGGHIHTARMTMAQAKALIHGTQNQVPVGALSQPSVVVRAYPNSETGNPLHFHDLTVFFDYVNHRFIVTNITNNALDNHEAFMIGDSVPAPGAAGEVLTSNGPNAAPSWQAAAGGGGAEPDVCIFKMDAASGTFGGSLISNWTTVTRIDENLLASWAVVVDPYTSAFSSFATTTAGTYEVIVECMITGNTNAPAYTWPDGLSAYGIDLEVQAPAIAQSPKTKVHTRYSPEQSHPNLPGNFGLSVGASSSEAGLAGSVSTFTERFIVSNPATAVLIPRMFATSYNSSSATAVCSATISFRMISNYTAE